LKELGVTHILNAAQQVPNFHPRELVYLKLDLIDAPDQKLAPWQDKVSEEAVSRPVLQI
jgi:hypothetical protein